ncbi:peptide/nickel transport system substrate-binding protein [Bradyrhizobium sp. CIR48]|uniref:ABC transporter substrate-binding protein n=1 Tax=Bradyrhizobium sp. CIR48 TaxID=2663840 RepID=UPI00160609AD|nr:ABC transporter substrate-binding protein [Bradyrhizobium sp. CIR48]MBB4423871.1 peptide/nickel transport system substrate-binding protein [Bradyrhizobium sp. CIR48]
MDEFTRRAIIQASLAAVGTAAVPRIAIGQGRKIIRAVGKIDVYDPVVGTSYATSRHACQVYDTLFGLDQQGIPRPQMVGKYEVSDDKLTWTFELREGLKFHDNAPVTAADVVPSIRRWAARSGLGSALSESLKDITPRGEKTFTLELKERFGLVLEALSWPFIMRKKEAETDPTVKIREIVGSGPFKFNEAETKPGAQYVYDRNPDYVPRSEPPSGMAGGKVVKIDRFMFVHIPDPQTAVSAVQAGEVDFLPETPMDLLDQLSKDENVKLEALYGGEIGLYRFNFLQPPFDNVKCRQAVLHLVDQSEFLKVNFPNPGYYKACASYFACGTSMENDANTDWFKDAPNVEKAKQLLKEGGYDGRPVVILQPTDWLNGKVAAEILAAQLRRAGVNVQLDAMAWAGLVARRAVRGPQDQGGWNIFPSSIAAADAAFPLGVLQQANGDKGMWGWPSDAKHEELRKKWGQADSIDERKKIAREMQDNAWNYVLYVWYGQWVQPSLMRANIKGMLKSPSGYFIPWWNVDKV